MFTSRGPLGILRELCPLGMGDPHSVRVSSEPAAIHLGPGCARARKASILVH